MLLRLLKKTAEARESSPQEKRMRKRMRPPLRARSVGA
jgi:hypothetical protein